MLIIIFRFKKSLVLVFALGCVAVALTYSFDPVFAAKLAVQSAFSRSALSSPFIIGQLRRCSFLVIDGGGGCR